MNTFMKRSTGLFASALLGLSLLCATAEATDSAGADPARPVIEARFTLVDHNGNAVTEQTYRGKWLLVFFGYTSCPDICPTTLYDMALTLKALGDDAGRIQALFVSVDPERDTVDVLAEYIPAFGASITGLTGEPENVKQAARAFRAHYEKVVSPEIPGGYTMDHQSSLYLIRPDGGFETAFPHGMAVERMVKAICRYITCVP
jgi:protein SCO1/2